MKNVWRLLKKSFIGIPVAIFIYEMFNLTLSIVMKEYVKTDGFNLNQLIKDYVEYSLVGFGWAFAVNYIKHNIKDSDGNVIQRTKSTINLLGIIMIAIILIVSTLEGELAIGLVITAMILLLVCVMLGVIFLVDKKNVKDINKKIQEKQDKRD